MAASPPLQAREKRTSFARPTLLAVIVAVAASILLTDLVPIYAPGLLRFEHALGDVRTASLSDRLPSQHPEIAIVGIGEPTLNDYKIRLPIDRGLLTKLVDALDAAGAKVIGIDVLFARAVPPDGDDQLIEALRRAKAKVVLAAADERLSLPAEQMAQQKSFIARTGRTAGYANLAVERDFIVRFKAQPYRGSAFPLSFAGAIASAAGYQGTTEHRRIAWLLEPTDGSDTFLNVPAETLLGAADNPATKIARQQIKDKIVLIGSTLADVDQHLTPLSVKTHERTPGVVVHAQILAELIDGRHVEQLESNTLIQHLGLALLTALGFLIGWSYRLKRKGALLGSIATIAMIAVDTIVFWQFRIILPVVLAVSAWFIGEIFGHYLGRWFGPRRSEKSRWFGK